MLHRLVGTSVLAGIIGIAVAFSSSVRAEPSALGSPSFDRAPATHELRKDIRIFLAQAKGKDDLLLNAPPPKANAGDSLLTGAPPPKKGGDDLLLQGAPPAAGGNDLLLQGAPPPPAPVELTSPAEKAREQREANAEHERLFIESRYPSANTCATCHPRQYKQWSVSQHAYAQLSPVFMAMQMTINADTSTTNGDFCIRCHDPVGMNLSESLFASNLDRPSTSREGITCIVCHRVNRKYGKISGRLAILKGDIFQPVYGPTGDKELKRVLSEPNKYRVVTSKNQPGRAIHTKVIPFFYLNKPGFCGMCHDVTLLNGFRLEDAFSEYKQTADARKGITCQDCHMGKVQGAPDGYDYGPAAIVGGVPTRPRKLTDHFFAGPDYSIIHPGLFPHNVKAAQFKTMRQWLQFDYKAGWGTDKFENHIPPGYKFPKAWQSIDDRYDARQILNEQFRRLAVAKKKRLQVLRNGFQLSKIRVTRDDPGGLDFEIDVINATGGHAVPTGFDAERAMFLQVTVTDATGKVIYKSGDRDPNGDVRDAHSLYVHDGKLPLDRDLFSLQTKFLVRLNRGGEREQVLPINTSLAAQPFVRPETRATTIYGRPRGARKFKQTIEVGGYRTARYYVDGSALTGNGPYKIDIKFISQEIPVNLVAAIQGVGFDYGMSPKEIADGVVSGAMVVRDRTLTVGAKGNKQAAAGR